MKKEYKSVSDRMHPSAYGIDDSIIGIEQTLQENLADYGVSRVSVNISKDLEMEEGECEVTVTMTIKGERITKSYRQHFDTSELEDTAKNIMIAVLNPTDAEIKAFDHALNEDGLELKEIEPFLYILASEKLAADMLPNELHGGEFSDNDRSEFTQLFGLAA